MSAGCTLFATLLNYKFCFPSFPKELLIHGHHFNDYARKVIIVRATPGFCGAEVVVQCGAKWREGHVEKWHDNFFGRKILSPERPSQISPPNSLVIMIVNGSFWHDCAPTMERQKSSFLRYVVFTF